VGYRGVDEKPPEGEEGQVGGKAHPLHHGARDQGGGDDGEGALEGQEEDVGDGALGLEAHPLEEEVLQAAQKAAAVPEGQGVPEKGPAHAHKGQGGEAHHHGVQGVVIRRTRAVETSIQAVSAPFTPSARARPESPKAATPLKVPRCRMPTSLGDRVDPSVHNVKK